MGLGTGWVHHHHPTIVFVVTLLLTGVLVARRVRGGILIGTAAGTVIAIAAEGDLAPGLGGGPSGRVGLSVPKLSGSPFAWPDLSLVGAFSFWLQPHQGARRDGPRVFTLVSPTSSTPWEP